MYEHGQGTTYCTLHMVHQGFAAQGFALGLCYQLVTAATGTGGMSGLRQTRGRAVSNKSCSFYLK